MAGALEAILEYEVRLTTAVSYMSLGLVPIFYTFSLSSINYILER
jgi:hypothetical protein